MKTKEEICEEGRQFILKIFDENMGLASSGRSHAAELEGARLLLLAEVAELFDEPERVFTRETFQNSVRILEEIIEIQTLLGYPQPHLIWGVEGRTYPVPAPKTDFFTESTGD